MNKDEFNAGLAQAFIASGSMADDILNYYTMWALIYHDTHTDPEVYVGTEQECRRVLVQFVIEYLEYYQHWPERLEAAAELQRRTAEDMTAASEWALDYINEHCEKLDCWVMEVKQA